MGPSQSWNDRRVSTFCSKLPGSRSRVRRPFCALFGFCMYVTHQALHSGTRVCPLETAYAWTSCSVPAGIFCRGSARIFAGTGG